MDIHDKLGEISGTVLEVLWFCFYIEYGQGESNELCRS